MGRYRKLPQRSFADPELLLLHRPLPADSFEVRFRTTCDRLLPDQAFDALYSANGRPPISPSALTRLLLLQLKYGRSDRQAVEDLNYDVRWQYMCDLSSAACDFDFTVLHYHRLRLLFGTINRARIADLHANGVRVEASPAQQVLYTLRQAAIDLGLLDPEAVPGIDSTALFGAAAIQDAYRLLFQAIRQVLQVAAHAQPAGLAAVVARLRHGAAYQAHDARKPEAAWADPVAREAVLADYLHDTAILATALQACVDPAVQAALAQVQRLIGQNLLVHEDGTAQVKQEVAVDRQCSVVDPDMRHGRKSHARRFDGYKAHLLTDPASELILGLTVTPASHHDNTAVLPLLAQQEQPPPVVVGDHAYGGREIRQQALAHGTALVTPEEPVAPYAPETFILAEDARTLTCPAGITKTVSAAGYVRFPVTACRHCAHRADCHPGARGRQVKIFAGDGLVRNLRAYARTETGRKQTRAIRPVTERIIRHFVRCGTRHGRYFGLLKTGLQALLGAISHNLDRLGRHLSPPPAGRQAA